MGSEGGSQATRARWNSGLEGRSQAAALCPGMGGPAGGGKGRRGSKGESGRAGSETGSEARSSERPAHHMATGLCPAKGQAAGLCPEFVWRPGGLPTRPGTEQGLVSAPPLSSISCYGEGQVPRTWGNRLHGGSGPSLPCSRGLWASQVTGSPDRVLLGDTAVHLTGGAWVGTGDQGGGKPVKWGAGVQDEGLREERVCKLCKAGRWCPG